ncbi:uncharacterized protein [Dermacentor andersoni]|uniref:uncharacterized protein n=1 Tax=Dermacentor andersoni TaxID=34620 RepID=UPI002416D3A4|nr:uncharacterized protein LOC129383890 [Dermacentor andersoni]
MRKSGTLLLKILVAAAVLHKCMGSGKECTDGCPYTSVIYHFDSFRLEATSESEPQQFCLTFKRVVYPEGDLDRLRYYVLTAPYKVKYTTEDNTTREDSANVTIRESEINVYFNSRESGEPLPVKMRFVYSIECFVIEQPSQGTSYYHVFVSGSVTDGAYRECIGKLEQYSGGTANYLNKDRNCDQVMNLTKPMTAIDYYSG